MAKKQRDGQRCKRRVRHEFTTAEFKERTLQKNKLEREAELKEEQRASVNATMKAEIKAIQSQVTDLRSQLDDGGEAREVDAVCVMDRKKGVKHYYRHCPGQEGHDEKLATENMTEDDYQQLELPEEPKTAPEAAAGVAADPVEQPPQEP